MCGFACGRSFLANWCKFFRLLCIGRKENRTRRVSTMIQSASTAAVLEQTQAGSRAFVRIQFYEVVGSESTPAGISSLLTIIWSVGFHQLLEAFTRSNGLQKMRVQCIAPAQTRARRSEVPSTYGVIKLRNTVRGFATAKRVQSSALPPLKMP